MKSLFKALTFSFIAFYFVNRYISGIDLGYNDARNFMLVVVALAILNLFMPSILNIISLPVKGLGFLFLNFLLNAITLFLLTVLLSPIEFAATTLEGLRIPGVMLPSRDLTALQAGVLSALLFSVIYIYLSWLSRKK